MFKFPSIKKANKYKKQKQRRKISLRKLQASENYENINKLQSKIIVL
jgi:hypothetical protein